MGLLGKFMEWFRAIPIKQSSADRGAIKSAVVALKAGGAVGIFPEGQLSPDGQLLDLFDGTALIVRLSGTPCQCVGIKNTNKLMPSPSVVPRWAFATLTARWGTVRTFQRTDSTEVVMDWIRSELIRLTRDD